MNRVHVVIDDCGDWMGIYINGQLVSQDHETQFTAQRLLYVLQTGLNNGDRSVKHCPEFDFVISYMGFGHDGLCPDLESQLDGGSDEV